MIILKKWGPEMAPFMLATEENTLITKHSEAKELEFLLIQTTVPMLHYKLDER